MRQRLEEAVLRRALPVRRILRMAEAVDFRLDGRVDRAGAERRRFHGARPARRSCILTCRPADLGGGGVSRGVEPSAPALGPVDEPAQDGAAARDEGDLEDPLAGALRTTRAWSAPSTVIWSPGAALPASRTNRPASSVVARATTSRAAKPGRSRVSSAPPIATPSCASTTRPSQLVRSSPWAARTSIRAVSAGSPVRGAAPGFRDGDRSRERERKNQAPIASPIASTERRFHTSVRWIVTARTAGRPATYQGTSGT